MNERTDDAIAREAMQMIQAQDLGRWTNAHDRVALDALRAWAGPAPAVVGYGMEYMGRMLPGEMYRRHDDARSMLEQRERAYGRSGERRVVPLYRHAPALRTPTPERLLEIARATNLREHLHGVPPSFARPLLARFVDAVLQEALGIQPASQQEGAPA